MRPLWLYLHFPHLQLDTLSGSFDKSADKVLPLVILEQKSNKVIQLNAAAYETGIRLDMGLGSAAALAQDLLVHPYKADVEQAKLNEVAERLYHVTSDICLYPPDGILLRIHNMLQLYAGLPPYWQTLRNQLQGLNLDFHFATGYSPLMSRLLARAHWDNVSEDRQVMFAQAASCELIHSELPAKTREKLNRVGIQTVGDVFKLSLKDIAKRFDIELVTYLGRLKGEFQHSVDFYHPPEHFHRYIELMYEIETSEVLIHPLKGLLQSLEHFLKLRDQLTNELYIRLHHRDTDDLTVTVGSVQGEYKALDWLRLIELKLQELQLQAPTYAITLTTGQTHVRSPQKHDLFAGEQGTLSPLQLISLLQAKLGESAIHGLTLKDDFRPEVANQYCPPMTTSFCLGTLHASRPSFLLHNAQPLQEKVSIIQGPERLNTGWWDNKPVVRDYFIARSRQGKWYWVYRTPKDDWFLHGIFS